MKKTMVVSLVALAALAGLTNWVDASETPPFTVAFDAVAGHQYVVRESHALEIWHNGAVVDGSNQTVDIEYPTTDAHRFFTVDDAVDEGVPVAKICVVSDPHYFAPSLLDTNSPDFQAYLEHDRKLIAESHDIMESTIAAILAEKPDVLLVPGDLTKDGETLCHAALSNYFAQVGAAGIKVVVCPGNHDINNLHAVAYNSTGSVAVASITPGQFPENYVDCGYGEALSRDPASLSFVAEPVSNLWILSVDSALYIPNQTTAGHVKQETLSWISGVLADAAASNKTVLAMMHHGVVPHFAYQPVFFPKYLLDNYTEVAEALAGGGVGVVFTGHYHANDVAGYTSTNGVDSLFDVETGSTLTWPCPYRVVFLTADGVLNIGTKRIEEVAGFDDFQTYAHDFTYAGMLGASSNMLVNSYGLDPAQAAALSPAMAATFIAHSAGDEGTPDPYTQTVINSLLSSADPNSQALGAMLESLWDDPPPADNDVQLNTLTGEASAK